MYFTWTMYMEEIKSIYLSIYVYITARVHLNYKEKEKRKKNP